MELEEKKSIASDLRRTIGWPEEQILESIEHWESGGKERHAVDRDVFFSMRRIKGDRDGDDR